MDHAPDSGVGIDFFLPVGVQYLRRGDLGDRAAIDFNPRTDHEPLSLWTHDPHQSVLLHDGAPLQGVEGGSPQIATTSL